MDIVNHYSELSFEPTDYFAFSASEDKIFFDNNELSTQSNESRLALLHEVSHALLGHFTYSSDFELLIMEAQAWHKTKELCEYFDVVVDNSYIQDCIDSYDHWLTARSTCPNCQNLCLNSKQPDSYSCFVCSCAWHASSDRFSRVSLTIKESA